MLSALSVKPSGLPVRFRADIGFDSALTALRQAVERIAYEGLYNHEDLSGNVRSYQPYDELTTNDLSGMCGTYSSKLYDRMQERGYPVHRATSDHPIARLPDDRGSFHIYLSLNLQGREVVIDPTLGQFIKGHNRIFVGTRPELEALVMNPQTEIIGTSPRLTRQEAFWAHWGERPALLSSG